MTTGRDTDNGVNNRSKRADLESRAGESSVRRASILVRRWSLNWPLGDRRIGAQSGGGGLLGVTLASAQISCRVRGRACLSPVRTRLLLSWLAHGLGLLHSAVLRSASVSL